MLHLINCGAISPSRCIITDEVHYYQPDNLSTASRHNAHGGTSCIEIAPPFTCNVCNNKATLGDAHRFCTGAGGKAHFRNVQSTALELVTAVVLVNCTLWPAAPSQITNVQIEASLKPCASSRNLSVLCFQVIEDFSWLSLSTFQIFKIFQIF